MGVDVLLVSLGGTLGLRTSDAELERGLRAAGLTVATTTARTPREVRTFALTDLTWALAARAAARRGIAEHDPRTVLYTTTTAALLGPRRGPIRFDAPARSNRPGRHGAWQRPVERRRLRAAPFLVPVSAEALALADVPGADAVVVPIPVEPSGPAGGARDVTAITYAANPHKKGLDRVLAAWRAARREDEELLVAGVDGAGEPGVRFLGRLDRDAYRALVRRARVFVTAPRYEEFGLAQLEALADGCVLVTGPGAGPYVAASVARGLDPRLVIPDLAPAIRTALDDPAPGYATRAAEELAAYRRDAVDAVVAQRLAPRLS